MANGITNRFSRALSLALVLGATLVSSGARVALAQTPIVGLTPCATSQTINATSTSSSIALTCTGATVKVQNIGTAEAFIAIGGSSVAATTSNDSVPSGSCAVYSVVPSTSYMAAITATGTATLRVTQGNGASFICTNAAANSSGATSVSNSDGSLTISPTTGPVVASLALGHANTWTGQQTFVAPILGTPASVTLTNATGLPIAGITGLGANVGTALGSALNGSGALVGTTSPSFMTPAIDAATGTSLALTSAGFVSWNADTFLVRDAANTLAQRNGTNAQTFNVYGTRIDASNYDRLAFFKNGPFAYTIGTQYLGTGQNSSLTLLPTSGGTLYFGSNGGVIFEVTPSSSFTPVTDNVSDIGSSILRPRNVYAATHFISQGSTPPVASTCGGGAVATGSTDNKGQITGITAATACTLTFNSALVTAPSCALSSSTGIAVGVSAISTAAFTSTMAALTGSLYYLCL